MSDALILDEIACQVMSQGRALESGWEICREVMFRPDLPPLEVRRCRDAFLFGAQHLFDLIILALAEDTDKNKGVSSLGGLRGEVERAHGALLLRYGRALRP